MDKQLFKQAMIKYFGGVILLGCLIFIPAGTLRFWRGWLLMAALFIPMFCAGIVMMLRCPDLLRKRLQVNEGEKEQRQVIACSGLMFLCAFILAGLNERFRWLPLPAWVSWAACSVLLIAYALYAEVLRENAYLSRTVEVQKDQKVIDTGMYGIVRHPMYAVTLVLFLAMPLILGSLPSFAVMLLYFPLIARRIRNEEKVLETGLPGYAEYKTRVRWRLLPYIW